MIPISSSTSSGLTWSKRPRTRNYELKLNGDVVGTLSRTGFWCPNFVAETQSGCWTFRRGGFLGTGAEIVEADRAIATFKAPWGGGGTLTFADGETFHLECKGWWRPVWTLVAENGQPVLHVHRREKTVDVATGSAIADSRLSLLLMFAWYRVLQAQEDAAAAASIAVIAAS